MPKTPSAQTPVGLETNAGNEGSATWLDVTDRPILSSRAPGPGATTLATSLPARSR
jgi:hypothetical protein